MSLGFVSETEIEEKKKKRQEEWEKVRNAEDPEICPEEPYDGRSLYDRLKEQKDKKEEEIAEQFKIRNMVKGLESDEVQFLDSVDKQKAELDKERWLEEQETIAELKSRMETVVEDGVAGRDVNGKSNGTSAPAAAPPTKPSSKSSLTSQRALLTGVVRRKRASEPSQQQDGGAESSDQKVKQSRPVPDSEPAAVGTGEKACGQVSAAVGGVGKGRTVVDILAPATHTHSS